MDSNRCQEPGHVDGGYAVFGLGEYAKLPCPVDGSTYLFDRSEAERRIFAEDGRLCGVSHLRGDVFYALRVDSREHGLRCFLMASNGEELGWANPEEVEGSSRHAELVLEDACALRTLTADQSFGADSYRHAGESFYPTRPSPSFGSRMCYLLFPGDGGLFPVEVPCRMLDEVSRLATPGELRAFLGGGTLSRI